MPGISNLKAEDRDRAAAFGLMIDWKLVKLLADHEYELLRLSFTFKEDEVLMVTKVRQEGTQYVVFVSRRDPMGCMQTFVRRLTEDTLKIYPDRFA